MCTLSCFGFEIRNIKSEDAKGKTVVEVASDNVNGSYRPIVEVFHPVAYTGVDGPVVDLICDVSYFRALRL